MFHEISGKPKQSQIQSILKFKILILKKSEVINDFTKFLINNLTMFSLGSKPLLPGVFVKENKVKSSPEDFEVQDKQLHEISDKQFDEIEENNSIIWKS